MEENQKILFGYEKHQLDKIVFLLNNIEVKGKQNVFSLAEIYSILENGNQIKINQEEVAEDGA